MKMIQKNKNFFINKKKKNKYWKKSPYRLEGNVQFQISWSKLKIKEIVETLLTTKFVYPQ